MKIPRFVLAILLVVSIFSFRGAAQHVSVAPVAASAPTVIPTLVPFSSVAAAGDGKMLTGEIGITFLIYKDEEGGEPLWTETQAVVSDTGGRYRVQLGAASPNGLPADLFSTGEARWLEVQIAGEKPQSRVLLASVPYAFKAADSATLGGLPASAFALAGSNVAVASVTASAITPDAAATVTTTGGTAGYVPEFTGAATIANSPIFVKGASVGIGTVAPAAALDVNGPLLVTGDSTLNGQLLLPAPGTATAKQGYNSQLVKLYTSAYNSSTKSVVAPRFEWEAEVTGNDTAAPGATLNLLASTTSAVPAETGFYLNTNGTIHFAAGQTFPGGTGTGTITGVTAGTGLTGGGTSGNVTLNVDTGKIPTLTGNNTFTGSNVFVPSIYEDTDVNIDNKNANSGKISPGLRFGSASGEGMASKRTSGGNQYGVDIYTGYAARLSVNAAGDVAIGTGAAFDGSQLQVRGATGAGGEFSGGVTNDSYGDNVGAGGVIATGGSSSSSVGSFAASWITATGGNASGSTSNTFAGDGGDFLGGTASNAGCCYEGGAAGDSPAPLPYTGSGIISVGGFAATGQPGYGVVAIGGSTNTGTPAPGLYVISGTDQNSNQGASATFNGDINVSGAVNADVKNFRIDHPADPANKYLVHTSIESSEMVNIYSGNVTTDEFGLATVKLPDWFQVENGDFRYQLTVVGGRFAQAIVSKEIANNQFTIMTNASGVKVSWQVTGVRQDAYAKAHPLVVEQAKRGAERGLYLHPELYGQPKQKQTELGQHPEIMRRFQAARNARKTALEPLQTPVAKPVSASVSH
jgi:hypothetical protein